MNAPFPEPARWPAHRPARRQRRHVGGKPRSGYAIVGHLRTSLVADALANAAAARDPAPGVIFHSDRGYQAVRLS